MINSIKRRWDIAVYNMLTCAAVFAGLPAILPTVLLYRKRRQAVLHRLGMLPAETRGKLEHIRKSGRAPIWIHALSVGEIFSTVPVVEAFAKRLAGMPIVFSTTTRTGYDLAVSQMRDIASAVIYFPFDFSCVANRCVERIRPSALVLVESDLWPNLFYHTTRRGIPVVLINGRISDKSFRGYKRFSFLTRPMFASLSRVCAQSEADAGRFQRLGVPEDRISVTGSTKLDPPHTIVQAEKRPVDRARLGLNPARKLLVAGSTHPGEEEILKTVLVRLKRSGAPVSLIVAPRDPERAFAVKRIFESVGFAVGLATEDRKNREARDVVVVDVIGMLKHLYGLGDFAFVGGSMVEEGGHNPLEPALFAVPVLFGPHMSDFHEIACRLVQSGGAIQVSGEEPLYDAVAALAGDPDKTRRIGSAAAGTLEANRGALEKAVDIVAGIALPGEN